MQRTITRTITVEVLYTDAPGAEEGQEWNELGESADEEIVKSERGQALSDWFRSTNYVLLDDEISVSPR